MSPYSERDLERIVCYVCGIMGHVCCKATPKVNLGLGGCATWDVGSRSGLALVLPEEAVFGIDRLRDSSCLLNWSRGCSCRRS